MGRLRGADDPLRPAEAVSLGYVEDRDREWQDVLLAAARVVEQYPRPDVADVVARSLRRAVACGEPIRLSLLAEIDIERERRDLTEFGPVGMRPDRRSA